MGSWEGIVDVAMKAAFQGLVAYGLFIVARSVCVIVACPSRPLPGITTGNRLLSFVGNSFIFYLR
jgi:hypothetical protein